MSTSKGCAVRRDDNRASSRFALLGWVLLGMTVASAPVFAQSNPCGNVNQRGAKIGGAGNGVQNNVPDYVESPPGTFTPNSYSLNSSSSRPNLVTGVTYTWSQTAGTAGTLSPTSAASTVFTLPNIIKPAGAPANWPGEVLKVKLTIVSTLPGCPGTWEDTATFNVIDIYNPIVNLPPNAQAAALPATVAEGNTVALSAAGSYDPEGHALTYAWTQISGTTVSLAGANSANASFVAPNTAFPGGETLEFSLRVSDGTFEDVQDVAVNVTWVNDPPMAVVECPLAVNEGESFTLDGRGSSDSDDGIASFEWTGGWSGLNLSSAHGSTLPLVAPHLGYQDPGIYDFRLTTYDGASHAFDECQVLVRDVTAPLISVPDDIEQEATGPLGNTVSYLATAFDAVDGSLLAADFFACAPASGHLFPLGVAPQKSTTTPVTCQAHDSAGNSNSRSFNITIGDHTAPTFTVPADFTVEATAPGGAAVEFAAPSSDVVDGAGQATCVPASGSTLGLGAHGVSCVATDARGNASDAQDFTVTVADTLAPLVQVPEPIVLEATGASGAVATFASTWTDAVDTAGDAECVPPSGSTFGITTTQVTCSHTDTSGNTGSANFDVTVQDTTPPTIEVPAPFTREATGPDGALVTYTALKHDVVDGTSAASCSPASGTVFPLDGTTVECTAQDAHGNAAEPAHFLVTVVDTTPPVLTVPASVQAEATSAAGAVVSYSATAVDLVDGDVAPICAPASGSTFALGSTEVGCYAIDHHGNATATQRFNVTVVDTTPPTLTVPASFSVEATGPNGAVATYVASAHDSVDGDLAPVCSRASGATFPLGATTVTCHVSDAHGNAAAPKDFTVTVVDTTPPTLTVPASFSVEATGPNGAIATYLASAHDLVDGNLAPVCSRASGAQFPMGATTVTCNVADSRGNAAASRSFTVTVVDTTAPTLHGLVDVAVPAGGQSQAVVNYAQPTATDIVDPSVTVNCTPPSGWTFPMQATTVQCSATDAAGNTARGNFKVTVSYRFNGFFQPIDNGVINSVKAGSAIPVKFSLGGNQGLQIFAAGAPSSAAMTCGATASDEVELTVTAGASTLQYDAGSDQYTYVWKTDKSWLGCRQLRVTLKDGSVQTAVFKFR